MSDQAIVVQYKNEINTQLADKETMQSLVNITFKGLTEPTMKRAILEGLMRGFKFLDFLKKDVYAIPYGDSYNLVTSIDYARKIGMKSGVVGKNAPEYTYDAQGKVESCTVTIKRSINQYIGDFTATVFFNEYYQGNKNPDGTTKTNKFGEVKPTLWDTKPRTMIAKVAEMHALRMACPEELGEAYAEEEFEQNAVVQEHKVVEIDTTEAQKKLIACKTLPELQSVWVGLTAQEKKELEPLKNEVKADLIQAPVTTKEVTLEEVSDIIDGDVVEPIQEAQQAFGGTIVEEAPAPLPKKPLSNPHLEEARKRLKL